MAPGSRGRWLTGRRRTRGRPTAGAPTVDAAVGRQRRPGQRVLDGDRGDLGVVEVVDELGEQLAGALELVAHRAADRQVVGERLAQRAHATPAGHGRARVAAPQYRPWRRSPSSAGSGGAAVGRSRPATRRPPAAASRRCGVAGAPAPASRVSRACRRRHHVGYRTRRHARVRGLDPDEHPTVQCRGGTTSLEVAHQRLADIAGQRKTLVAVTHAPGHDGTGHGGAEQHPQLRGGRGGLGGAEDRHQPQCPRQPERQGRRMPPAIDRRSAGHADAVARTRAGGWRARWPWRPPQRRAVAPTRIHPGWPAPRALSQGSPRSSDKAGLSFEPPPPVRTRTGTPAGRTSSMCWRLQAAGRGYQVSFAHPMRLSAMP